MSFNKNFAPTLETTDQLRIDLPDTEAVLSAAGNIAMKLFFLNQVPSLGVEPGALEALIVTVEAGDALRQAAPNN